MAPEITKKIKGIRRTYGIDSDESYKPADTTEKAKEAVFGWREKLLPIPNKSLIEGRIY